MVFDMMNMVSVLMVGGEERDAVNACVGTRDAADATVRMSAGILQDMP